VGGYVECVVDLLGWLFCRVLGLACDLPLGAAGILC